MAAAIIITIGLLVGGGYLCMRLWGFGGVAIFYVIAGPVLLKLFFS